MTHPQLFVLQTSISLYGYRSIPMSPTESFIGIRSYVDLFLLYIYFFYLFTCFALAGAIVVCISQSGKYKLSLKYAGRRDFMDSFLRYILYLNFLWKLIVLFFNICTGSFSTPYFIIAFLHFWKKYDTQQESSCSTLRGNKNNNKI